jgi:hypothetical protein
MIARSENFLMRSSILRAAVLSCVALVCTAAVSEDKLEVGSTAPAFAPKNVLKGETPDVKTDSGCVVLCFMVSNDAASKKPISVLNRLWKEFGASGRLQVMCVFDEDARDTEAFLKTGLGTPECAVCADRDGSSRRDWVGGAQMRALPAGFIIGRGGRLLWLGSQFDATFEATVRKAMTGRYDPAAREKIDPALKAAVKCADVRNWGEAYKHFDEAIDVDPVIALDATAERYKTTLLKEGKPDVANAWLVQVAKKRYASDLTAIGDLVDLLLKDPEVKPRSPETAELVVDAATQKSGSGILALKAQVAHAKGDVAKAVELQTDAWMSAAPDQKAALKRALDEYRAAAKRQKAGAPEGKRGA